MIFGRAITSDSRDQRLLAALLDSWDRSNAILLNLLHALLEGGLEAKATAETAAIGLPANLRCRIGLKSLPRQELHFHSVESHAPKYRRCAPECPEKNNENHQKCLKHRIGYHPSSSAPCKKYVALGRVRAPPKQRGCTKVCCTKACCTTAGLDSKM